MIVCTMGKLAHVSGPVLAKTSAYAGQSAIAASTHIIGAWMALEASHHASGWYMPSLTSRRTERRVMFERMTTPIESCDGMAMQKTK